MLQNEVTPKLVNEDSEVDQGTAGLSRGDELGWVKRRRTLYKVIWTISEKERRRWKPSAILQPGRVAQAAKASVQLNFNNGTDTSPIEPT
jgi:hypothetical protein